ncbi:hypothetical protein HYH39_03210 [Clostridium botulinum]|nr:hypothetical protein [Clostridium botulinum]
MKLYEKDNEYILDVLEDEEDEEDRLLEKLGEILSEETRYLFYRYVSVIETINCIKSTL